MVQRNFSGLDVHFHVRRLCCWLKQQFDIPSVMAYSCHVGPSFLFVYCALFYLVVVLSADRCTVHTRAQVSVSVLFSLDLILKAVLMIVSSFWLLFLFFFKIFFDEQCTVTTHKFCALTFVWEYVIRKMLFIFWVRRHLLINCLHSAASQQFFYLNANVSVCVSILA